MTSAEFQVFVAIMTIAGVVIANSFLFGWKTSKLVSSVETLASAVVRLTEKLDAHERILTQHSVHLAAIEERCQERLLNGREVGRTEQKGSDYFE